ncbi:hypothetical protein GCM10017653_25180 [Ancylobacter defluvii]|uniref:Uncharacterized protein n=1 Tax=Ancylobacter defluvii TaxID=1282440 RepID=A0A9W6NB87_9HYPH|nr:hypothetical protein GCM10017653_25180 [Ancylobacter defluvii]
MDYLGGLRGTGLLLCGNASVAPAQYDFDGYISNSGQVTSCGEIRLQASTLREVFGRDDLHLRTAEGRLLSVRFSEKRVSQGGGAAHVDVNGELPAAADWRRRSGARSPKSAPGPNRLPILPLQPRTAQG